MGNHNVGRAMAAGADAILKLKSSLSQDEALSALDSIAYPWHGSDAEFDDELFDGVTTPLGRLVATAFNATDTELHNADDENGDSAWATGPYEKFRNRYRFC